MKTQKPRRPRSTAELDRISARAAASGKGLSYTYTRAYLVAAFGVPTR